MSEDGRPVSLDAFKRRLPLIDLLEPEPYQPIRKSTSHNLIIMPYLQARTPPRCQVSYSKR